MLTPQFVLLLNDEIVVDNFAGGGGASTGIERAIGRPVDVALNHDPKALAMHRMNHPQTVHYCEDIRAADPVKIAAGRPVGRVGRPDLDNLEKSFLDVMTRLQFWQDDSQVTWKQTLKFWDVSGKLVVDVASAPELAPREIKMEQLELGQLLGF